MALTVALCGGVARYTTAKDAAASSGFRVETVWAWARSGLCAAKRLPGRRGRLVVGVDADGYPVPTGPGRARRR